MKPRIRIQFRYQPYIEPKVILGFTPTHGTVYLVGMKEHTTITYYALNYLALSLFRKAGERNYCVIKLYNNFLNI